jgi:hypothetical protein
MVGRLDKVGCKGWLPQRHRSEVRVTRAPHPPAGQPACTRARRALSEMIRCCSEARAVAALIACAGHKSMHVRAKVRVPCAPPVVATSVFGLRSPPRLAHPSSRHTSVPHSSSLLLSQIASHIDGMLELSSSLPRTLLASNPALLDKLFRVAAGFLEEGAHALPRCSKSTTQPLCTCCLPELLACCGTRAARTLCVILALEALLSFPSPALARCRRTGHAHVREAHHLGAQARPRVARRL